MIGAKRRRPDEGRARRHYAGPPRGRGRILPWDLLNAPEMRGSRHLNPRPREPHTSGALPFSSAALAIRPPECPA